MRAEAGIGGTYGAMPEMFLKLERCFVEGNIKEAQKWQIRINEIIIGLSSFNNLYAATKEILRLSGVDIGSVRAPMMPLSESESPKARALYEKIMQYTGETTD